MLSRLPVLGLSAALAAVLGGSAAYISHERTREHQIQALNVSLSDSLSDMQHQVEALTKKIADLSTVKPNEPVPTAATIQKAPRPTRAVHTTPRVVQARSESRPDDPRFKDMQAQLTEQQKQIVGTREDLDKAKDELNGKLSSTRDDLSGAIAKDHDEVVELQKHGERSYYEFQLDKSKGFDRIGPIRLSLRKADVKHKHFNMALMVDDNQLEKKNVDLYEPVWFHLGEENVEVVVNQITKDHVQGYVSEPKYKKPDGRSSAAGPIQ